MDAMIYTLVAVIFAAGVAAGWAVDDDAARVFAGRFYDSLLLSRRFIDAVADARHATWKRGGTTWAAYQCYGDPDWTLRRDVRAPPASAEDIAAEFVDIATAAELAIALDSIAIRSRAPFADIALERARLSHLQARFELRWPDRGDVLAASARAHEALGDVDGASKRRARALAATNAEAPRDPPAFDAIAQRIVEASDRGTLGVQRTALLDDIHALAKRHPSPAAWQRLHARMRASLHAGADARTLLRAIEAVAR